MKNKLNNIVRIQTGVFAQSIPHADTLYLQPRDVDPERKDSVVPQPAVAGDRLSQHILQEGDVLFVAKGVRFFSVVYRSSMGRAVASSSFLVLRILPEYRNLILPEYLSFFLNHKGAQQYYLSQSKGTALPHIPISELGELNIIVSPLVKQEMIVSFDEMRKRETELTGRIQALKHKLYDQQLLKIISEQ